MKESRRSLRIVTRIQSMLDRRLRSRRWKISSTLQLHLPGLINAILKDGILHGPSLGGIDGSLDGPAQGLVGQMLDLVLRKLNLERTEVLLDALRSDTLSERNDTSSHRPSQQDLGRSDVVPLRNIQDDGMVEILGCVLVRAEWRVGLKGNAVSMGIVAKLLVVNTKVDLDLVDKGLEIGCFKKLADTTDVEVANTNAANLALLDHFFHETVCGHKVTRETSLFDGVTTGAANGRNHGTVGVEESNGPVHEVQVEIVRVEIFQGIVQGLFNVGRMVERVPEL